MNIFSSYHSYINLILLLTGVFLVAPIHFFIEGTSPTDFTHPYRIISLTVAIAVIILNQQIRKSRYYYLLLSFFILFFLRFFYDLFIVDINYKENDISYIATYLGAVVLPTLSIFFIDFRSIKLNVILKILYVFYYFFCFGNLLFYDFPNEPVRSSGISGLWPISFGQAGVSLALLSLSMLVSRIFLIDKIIYLSGFFIGILIVLISASKGPWFTLPILCILYALLNRKRLQNIDWKYMLPGFLIGFILLYFFLSESNSVAMFIRINESFLISDLSTIQRIEILHVTISNIIENPILGTSLFITEETIHSQYPHFLILEAFMTMGLVGGVLFLIINFLTLRSTLFLSSFNEYQWIILLFLQYFIQTFFSSSLHASTFFWILSAIVITISFQKKLID